jgi:hypothetical protein
MYRGHLSGECSAERPRIRAGYLYPACCLLLAAFAVLALSSVSSAQDAGKGGDAKGSDAQNPPIDWTPTTKLDWKDFKGGKPKKDDEDANTVVLLYVSPTDCDGNGNGKFDVRAQFDPNMSATKGAQAQDAALLAHEQIHFDLMEKQARKLKEKLKEIYAKYCTCPMNDEKRKALNQAIEAAMQAALNAYDAENNKYDEETDHGTKSEAQQKWAADTAKALGQPAPTPPTTTDQPQTPQATKPDAACADCEKLEAERKKQLAELEKQVAPLRQQSKALFGQIDALETQISALNADIQAQQQLLSDPKKKSGAESKIKSDNQKIKSDQESEKPLKTKKEGVDKQIEELEKKIAPLQEPIKCPKCNAASGNSSYVPSMGDGFASASPGGPVTVKGKACPPPSSSTGYVPFPGTPGQQYATLIPGGYTPGESVSYSTPSFATDSEVYCTFGEGTGVPGYVTASNDNGDFIPPTSDSGKTPGTPPGTAMTPKPSQTPTPQATEPKTASTPTPAPSPSDTPKMASTPTDTPVASNSDTPVPQTTDTPQQPTDTPTPEVPTDTPQITIFIKASEEVLTGGQTGDPIGGQVVKLVMRDKPELPTTTGDRTLTDKGFDKPAPQCTTGADGGCKIDVPAEDRPLYALDKTPRLAGKVVTKFRLAVNIMKHTGGVAETTGKQVPDLKDALTAANATAEVVSIGSRTFLRLGFNTPYGSTEEFAKRFSELLGVPVEVDICLVKEPGPPLGSEPVSYAAINQELPNATIALDPPAKRGAR